MVGSLAVKYVFIITKGRSVLSVSWLVQYFILEVILISVFCFLKSFTLYHWYTMRSDRTCEREGGGVCVTYYKKFSQYWNLQAFDCLLSNSFRRAGIVLSLMWTGADGSVPLLFWLVSDSKTFVNWRALCWHNAAVMKTRLVIPLLIFLSQFAGCDTRAGSSRGRMNCQLWTCRWCEWMNDGTESLQKVCFLWNVSRDRQFKAWIYKRPRHNDGICLAQ